MRLWCRNEWLGLKRPAVRWWPSRAAGGGFPSRALLTLDGERLNDRLGAGTAASDGVAWAVARRDGGVLAERD